MKTGATYHPISAGLLFYRFNKKKLEVLLVHPGGPFWAKKDEGAWTIPKGEVEEGENPLVTAVREVNEETGITARGNFIELSPIKQKSGKQVYAWAIAMEFDPATLVSNTFEMEWPPKSGTKKSFPEIDKAGWFTLAQAEKKMIKAQQSFLHELKRLI